MTNRDKNDLRIVEITKLQIADKLIKSCIADIRLTDKEQLLSIMENWINKKNERIY